MTWLPEDDETMPTLSYAMPDPRERYGSDTRPEEEPES